MFVMLLCLIGKMTAATVSRRVPPCPRPSAALERFARHSAYRLNPELAEENNLQNECL